ncbi:acetylornithine aminotransferase [Hyphopichia burtonii NRRL Y-1933]|uniref:Acetylornithine aminotransferase, mitochondrial n=1 Tax=Hyphopichia burtonii NRRL Y-1933 TaxID=984485 RepID=A0A1E4RRE4_9ASCO|nr:acetylornithine aminotransferase [Hyphopichia burtonii NRRL Y-1933]ODV69832.1 acetylornithine aminotransferase [Hyphopichia burtonii NRRL Y-1933]
MIRSISAKCLRTRLVGSKQCFSTTTRVFNSSTGIPDATEESHTGQYINTITKPYTATTYARPNVVITHGKGSHLYDLENRQYIDFTAGIAVTCLGHSDPEITNIISEQAKTLIHCSNLYYNLPAGELLSKLVHKTLQAGGMKDAQRVFLCNSGTEANEAALKFARKHGKNINEEKTEIITFNNSFHGRSMGALSVTPNPKYQAPFAPLIPGVQVADINDIKSVETLMKKDKTCAVIIEPIQGEGGVTPVDSEFLVALRKLCDENDVVLIYDEIQCGLGRTGKLWAHCDLPQEAHPDILTMAKALGNGFPIGATMISEKIEKSLNVGDHGTTYGGNPLGAKIGSYVVDKISKPEFLESVNQKAEKFNKKLTAIAENYPNIITSVKGKGLLMGLQFKENVDIASIVSQCRQHGLLVITAGMNVIRLVPALNIPDDVIQDGLNILSKCLDDSLAKYKIEDPLTKN